MGQKKKGKTVKPKEIAIYRQRLRKILNIVDEDKRLVELKQLAKEVGAGYEHTEIAAATTIPVTTRTKSGSETVFHTSAHQNTISESELVLNINNALQTETMIDMCRTATRDFWIALVSVIIAVLAMVAAWAAVIVKVKCGQ
jgi:hypothetical protein